MAHSHGPRDPVSLKRVLEYYNLSPGDGTDAVVRKLYAFLSRLVGTIVRDNGVMLGEILDTCHNLLGSKL